MRLVLIRHGRAREGDRACAHDPPLCDEGAQQARAVAAYLAGEGITRIVSSPLMRARQTAEPLAARLGLGIDLVEGWAEADRHLDRYRSLETLRNQGPVEWERFLGDPAGYFGGDAQTFRAQVLGALREAAGRGERDAHIAIFTHGLPINVVLSYALGLERIVHFTPGHGSLTRLRVLGPEALTVVSVNERAYRDASADVSMRSDSSS